MGRSGDKRGTHIHRDFLDIAGFRLMLRQFLRERFHRFAVLPAFS